MAGLTLFLNFYFTPQTTSSHTLFWIDPLGLIDTLCQTRFQKFVKTGR